MKKLILLSFAFLSGIIVISGQEYTIDPIHTNISFKVNRFAMIDVVGRFNDFAGNISVDKATGEISDASLTINVNSIDTGHEVRDGHLKGEIWLDATNHPEIVFEATSISYVGNIPNITGNLTIHGTTKEVSFPFEVTGPGVDPTKKTTIGISGSIVIDRQDYGIKFSRLMDNGKLFIGNEVSIEIHALAQIE